MRGANHAGGIKGGLFVPKFKVKETVIDKRGNEKGKRGTEGLTRLPRKFLKKPVEPESLAKEPATKLNGTWSLNTKGILREKGGGNLGGEKTERKAGGGGQQKESASEFSPSSQKQRMIGKKKKDPRLDKPGEKAFVAQSEKKKTGTPN